LLRISSCHCPMTLISFLSSFWAVFGFASYSFLVLIGRRSYPFLVNFGRSPVFLYWSMFYPGRHSTYLTALKYSYSAESINFPVTDRSCNNYRYMKKCCPENRNLPWSWDQAYIRCFGATPLLTHCTYITLLSVSLPALSRTLTDSQTGSLSHVVRREDSSMFAGDWIPCQLSDFLDFPVFTRGARRLDGSSPLAQFLRQYVGHKFIVEWGTLVLIPSYFN
jgi:hypothetical protein